MAHLRPNINSKTTRQSAVDFKDILNACPAINGGAILRLGIGVDLCHLAIGIGKDHVERNQRVRHPELRALRFRVDKQHARSGGHLFHEHQAFGAFIGIICDVDGKAGLTAFPPQFDLVIAAGSRRDCT